MGTGRRGSPDLTSKLPALADLTNFLWILDIGCARSTRSFRGSGLKDDPYGVALFRRQHPYGVGSLGQRHHPADRAGELHPLQGVQRDEIGHVVRAGAVVTEDLLLEIAEPGASGLTVSGWSVSPTSTSLPPGRSAQRPAPGRPGRRRSRRRPRGPGRRWPRSPLGEAAVAGVQGEVGTEVAGPGRGRRAAGRRR